MPSSNKTPVLSLNQWIGADKPKKDDFNADNLKIDEAHRAFQGRVDQFDARITAGLSAHTGSTGVHVTQNEKTSWNSAASNVSAHLSNSGIHVTAAEKQAWSKSSDLLVGAYTGNGTTSQKITLGFQPQFGIIFIVGDGLGRVNWVSSQYYAYSGCMSQLGCSYGIAVNTDGFTVEHSLMNGLDGFTHRFNSSGQKYVYFIWK